MAKTWILHETMSCASLLNGLMITNIAVEAVNEILVDVKRMPVKGRQANG